MPALIFLCPRRHIRAGLSARAELAPFRLQFYCNGHSWLARKLAAVGIGYTMAQPARQSV